ncbi:hypothetical protein G4177_32090 [Corallococcus sp. ZKHCc1 1396]|uniref:Uncharacterized protein n=1 Tax=Corallococcus soli TaxID=2710757 RepID=A0ABR9PY06_9BACT|nr:hypothetical protein [Corallococcus soli]MBE4752807.1 hypothetical protein [Corallococcus soli]
MTSRRLRSLPSLVRHWIRAPLLGSLALGGPLLATSAHAVELDDGTPSIVGVAMEDGELMARIHWAGSEKTLPERVTLVAYDGQGNDTARLELSPEPGKVSEVRIAGAVREPWETGWAQKLVLRGPDGKELARQHYDVSLDCVDAKVCDLKVSPGVAAGPEVLHVSSALDATLVTLEKEYEGKAYDLVEAVTRRSPALRGEALAHSMALVRAPYEGACNCQWVTSVTRQGTQPVNPGPEHALTATPLRPTQPGSYRRTAQGSVQVSLRLNCQAPSLIRFQAVGVRQGSLVRDLLMPVPTLNTCVGRCSASYDHFGRISAQTTVNPSPTPNQIMIATATETGLYHLGNFPTVLLNENSFGNDSFDESVGASGVSTGFGAIQMSGEAWISNNGTPPTPTAAVRNGYAVGVRGSAVCPGGGMLFPIGRVWDVATTQGAAHQNSLLEQLWGFLGL